MTGILRVTPEAVIETGKELKQLSDETKKLIEKYELLLDKMNSALEGDEQTSFKNCVLQYLMDMERFAEVCDRQSSKLVEVAECYMEAEASIANDIMNSLL